MKNKISSFLLLLLLVLVAGCEYEFEYYTAEDNSDKANTVLNYTTNNSSLISIYSSDDAEAISNVYENGAGKIVLRGKRDYLPSYIFAYNYNLKSIVIPEGIKDIDNDVFYACENLVDVELPNSLEQINSEAFSGTSIKSLTLPENVQWMNYNAINISTLTTLFVKAAEPPVISYSSSGTFLNSSIQAIYVPQSAVNAYKSAYGWKNFSSKIIGYDFVNNRPAAKELVVGKYYFLSYVNSNNEKLYNTMNIEKTGTDTYEITNLLYPGSSERWHAVYDVENSCLVLSGKCVFTNVNYETITLDNAFMTVFRVASNGTARFTASWPSKSKHYAEGYDGRSTCVINVNPNTGRLESFDTFLSEEVFEYDEAADEIGSHLGYTTAVVDPAIYYGEKPYSYQKSMPYTPLNAIVTNLSLDFDGGVYEVADNVEME